VYRFTDFDLSASNSRDTSYGVHHNHIRLPLFEHVLRGVHRVIIVQQSIHPVNYQVNRVVDVPVALQDVFIASSGSSPTLFAPWLPFVIISISRAGRWLAEKKTALKTHLDPIRALLLRRRMRIVSPAPENFLFWTRCIQTDNWVERVERG